MQTVISSSDSALPDSTHTALEHTVAYSPIAKKELCKAVCMLGGQTDCNINIVEDT